MKLIGAPNSPFWRKARILALEKGIAHDNEVQLPFAPDTRVPDYNPLGKVPALVTDDGEVLYDSRVIVEYLETLAPRNIFTPAADHDRILVKRWEALADGCTDAQAVIVFERRRTRAEQISQEWIAWQRGKIDRALAEMSRQLGDRTWCHGDGMTLADIAVVCALGFLSLRFKEVPWRDLHPNLARLFDRLHERPSFAKTMPPGP